jgi:hypothetical protein
MKDEEKRKKKTRFKEINEIIQRAMEIEKELKEDYIAEFIEFGFEPREAKKAVKMLLKKAWKEYSKLQAPEMSGDKILEMEKTDEEVKTILAKKRNQGVRDDDLRWWWNMHDLEREMIELSGLFLRNASYRRLIRLGKTEDKAMDRVRKNFVCFSHSARLPSVDNEEPIVPIELTKRIDEYLERRDTDDPEQYRKDLEEMGTLTALVRKEIANGKL